MQEQETRLLMLVDDEPAQCRLVSAIASRAGWRTVFARDAETAIAMLGTQDGMMLEAIILDHWVPGADSASLISELKSRRPALPILLMTSIGSNEAAIDAMRAGASDYIIKPVAPDRLIAALSMAADKSKELGELHPLTEKITQPLAFEEIIGSAPALRTALAIAAKAARSRAPIFFQTGSARRSHCGAAQAHRGAGRCECEHAPHRSVGGGARTGGVDVRERVRGGPNRTLHLRPCGDAAAAI
jgi:DNA-binding NtrC family response regulator